MRDPGNPPARRTGNRRTSRGWHHTLATRQRIGDALRGKPQPWHSGDQNPAKRPEVREKIQKAKKGNKVWLGRHHSDISRKKMSTALKGKPLSLIHRQKLSEAHQGKPQPWKQGELHPNWQGGVSFEPYCHLFNRVFKEECRSSWGNVCVICGASPNGESLHVHHIHYDKAAGCNGRTLECIPLCGYHHRRTQYCREWWITYFENRLWNVFGWRLGMLPEET